MSNTAFITRPNNPNVSSTSGHVKNVRIGRTATFTKPKTSATIPISQPGPTKSIPGTRNTAVKIESELINQRRIKRRIPRHRFMGGGSDTIACFSFSSLFWHLFQAHNGYPHLLGDRPPAHLVCHISLQIAQWLTESHTNRIG